MGLSFTSHKPKIAAKPGAPKPVTLAPKAAPKTAPAAAKAPSAAAPAPKAKEIGGPSGPEPTRYGDWERKGICVDF